MSSRPPRHAALGKLSSPRLGRVFDRRRLFDLLDGLSGVPGVWLAAPPGAGKTTLVATWLRQREYPALWLRLDADDADPATFVQSLDALCGSLLAERLELPPFRGDDLSDLPGWLRRRMRHLLPHLPRCWTLVFDNQQELPVQSGLQVALAEMLVELPAGVQWIFASREPPPPAYTRALAGQQLWTVDAEHLRFDEVETRALIRLHGHSEAMAEPLSAARGWAAGMTLMLLGQPTGGPLPAHAARERLFDYFADEVLSRMPAAHQRTLGLLAFLPSTTAELAVAMSGEPDAPELLERLAAASLFTDRRGESPTVFAFHALFSAFLRRRVERSASADEVHELLLRSGRLLLAAGELEAGLQRLIEAQAWDEVEGSIRRSAPRYVDEGRVLALRRHIDTLPAAAAERLAYWRGACALDIDPEAALADMKLAFHLFTAAGDVQGQLEAAAGAATALLSTGRLMDLDPWIAVFSEHESHALQAAAPDAEMRLVPGMFAALTHHMPWHPMAEPLAERAERLLHQESAFGQRLLLGALAFHFLWRGRLDRLERIVLRVDTMCGQGLAAPPTLMRWWGVGILVKCLLGQVASAHADAQQALALVETEPSLARQRAHMELLAIMVALASRDAASVRRHLNRAAPTLHPDRAIDRAQYELERGMLALLEDDGPTALQLFAAAVHSARLSGFSVREHIALIGHALAAAYNQQHDVARQVLEQVRSHPIYPLCRWHHWVGGCVAAYAALQRGDHDDAQAQLRLAFGVAREHGFRHGPILFASASVIPGLVAFALAHDIEPEVARDLVMRHELKAPPEADDAWPWAVRVRVFGRLEVEVDGAPMAASRKESRRLLELLRLLAAHGGTPLAQDQAADQLWPEADGDAARNSLDNALHRLRRALGGDDRILLRHSALMLNPQRCWTDVQAVEQLMRQIEGATAPQLPGMLRMLQQLYRGPLLPDDEFPRLIAARRRLLHLRVQRASQLAAARLDQAGMADAARTARESLRDL